MAGTPTTGWQSRWPNGRWRDGCTPSTDPQRDDETAAVSGVHILRWPFRNRGGARSIQHVADVRMWVKWLRREADVTDRRRQDAAGVSGYDFQGGPI